MRNMAILAMAVVLIASSKVMADPPGWTIFKLTDIVYLSSVF